MLYYNKMYRRSINLNTKNQIKIPETTQTKIKEVISPSCSYDPINEIKEMFKLFDKDGDGKISNDEVSSLLVSLGRESTDEEIENLIKAVDKDGNKTIELNRFVSYMESYYKLSQDKVDNTVNAFKMFDTNGNGCISGLEFKNILMNYGGKLSEKEVEQIFKESNINNEGNLAYSEFVDIWKFQ